MKRQTLRAAMALSLMWIGSSVQAQTVVWHGGPIVTMDGPAPQIAEAVVTRDGAIVYVGNEAQALVVAGQDAQQRDLAGATMLPGFIDAHSHFGLAVQMGGGIDFGDPAAAKVSDIPGLLERLKSEVASRKIPGGEWVIVWRYDENALAEARHITRAELDSALPDHKVVLLHFTMHGLIANSASLAAFGVNEASPVPAGGVMTKDTGGRLTGLMFETAMYKYAVPAFPAPTAEQRIAALDAAQTSYARHGYTHAQEGATSPADLAFLTSEPARKAMKIDLALLPMWSQASALVARDDLVFGVYQGRVKIQGVKFVLDGSPQARTAFFTQDYALGSPGGDHPWHGEPGIKQDDFVALARTVHEKGGQLFVHANGDAAIDMAIKGFDALEIKASDNRRPVVIHSQFQRQDHLADYARIGVGPAYFTSHAHYFADIHRRNFPARTVDFISPMQSARAAGLTPSNHTDFPVTPLDPMMMVHSAMARASLTGVVSGPDERLSAYEALQTITRNAAWQMFEEDRKGRIAAGLLADFVILDRNPLDLTAEEVLAVKIIETVKQGETIWAAAD